MSDQAPTSVPPGWYDDGSGRKRWWDGTQWTEHLEPATQPTDVAVPAAADVAVAQTAAVVPQKTANVEVRHLQRFSMTAAEKFWYVLQCIAFGAGYFAKIPTKRALADLGMAQMSGAEEFWYVLQCIAFGAGYFAKVPVKRALMDVTST